MVRLLLLSAIAASPALAHNHFVLELEGGVAGPVGVDAEAEPGGTWGGVFGFGGRVPGQSPAYYLLGRVAGSGFGFVGPPERGSALVERQQTEWGLGGRVYLPFTDRLRLALTVMLGETLDCAEVRRPGHRAFGYESDVFTVFTDAGLQYRFTDHFSLGLGGGISWIPEHSETDLAARAAGVDDGGPIGRARFGLTTTFHF